jgi:uncharacterized protein involved in exopolysaccharide biosynthesis
VTPRFIDLIFRSKYLLLLPLVLGLLGGIYMAMQDREDTYESTATVWVERPSEITGGAFFEYNDFISPAANQQAAMQQLLGTKSFVRGVLDRLDGELPEGQDHPQARYDAIRFNTALGGGGNNVLFISHSDSVPEGTDKAVLAILDEYGDLYGSQLRDRAERAVGFYEEQLQISQGVLAAATAELQAYIATQPDLRGMDLEDPPTAALQDEEFARLHSAEQTARESYNTILDRYAESEFTAAATGGTRTNFIVLDEPEVPTAPLPATKRDLLLPPIFGIVLGSFLSVGIFVVRWRLDHKIRVPSDVALIDPSIPVMSLPSLKPKRHWPKSFVRLATVIETKLAPQPAQPRPGFTPAEEVTSA